MLLDVVAANLLHLLAQQFVVLFSLLVDDVLPLAHLVVPSVVAPHHRGGDILSFLINVLDLVVFLDGFFLCAGVFLVEVLVHLLGLVSAEFEVEAV